jgi:serine/threonine-protein kinase
MAPEQATGGNSVMDARADQFSLAAIAYEMLAGRMAFEGDGMVNVLYRVVHEAPPSFASLGVTTGAGVEAAILRALSKSPNGRFGTVLDFSDALKRASQTTAAVPRAEVATSVRPTSLLPAGRVATTTLRASTGEMEAVGGSEDSRDEFEVAATGRASRRKVVGLLSGVVGLAVAALAIVLLRGPAAGGKVSATSRGSSVQLVPPVAPAPSPTPVFPAVRSEPVAAEPATVPATEPVQLQTKSAATAKPTHHHRSPVRIPKAVTGKPARHPGPLNDNL